MAAGILLVAGWTPAVDSDGAPIPNARAYYYLDETTTLAPIFADEGLTTPLTNPVEANSSGRWPIIWASDANTYTWSIEAPYGPPGLPFTGTGLTASQATDLIILEGVNAAADQADDAAAAALDAYNDILALAAAAPDTDPIVIAGKANVTGSNILGANQAAFPNQLAVVQTGTGAATRTIPNKLRDVIFVEDFGAVGNGTTDDTTAIQAALTSASARSARGGGRVSLRPGLTYKTTNTLTVPANVTFDLNGSKLVPTLAGGDTYGLDPRNNSCVENGEIQVVSSGTPGSQSGIHAPINIGALYGYGGTVASPAANQYVSNVVLRNLTVSSNKSVDNGSGAFIGSAGIQMVGGVTNVLIENVTVPDSAFMLVGLGGDWGVVGTLSSTATLAAQNANKTAFNANLANTTHPTNITIKNVKIGALTRAYTTQDTGAFGVRFSGCINVVVDGASIESTTNAAVAVTAGDLGAEFAPALVKPLVRKGHAFRNVIIKNGSTGYGVQTDAFADNIATAVGLGYTALYTTILTTTDVYENITGVGPGNSGANYGFRVSGQRGCSGKNLNFSAFRQGFNVDQNAFDMTFSDCVASLNREHGALIEHPTFLPDNIIFERLVAFSNGQDAGFSAPAGIKISNSRRCGCIGGVFGKTGVLDSGQRIGLFATDDALFSIIEENHVFSTRVTDGIAYLFGSGSGANTFLSVNNNRQDAVYNPTAAGGQTVVPFITAKALNDGHDVPIYTAQRGQLTGGTTPQFGTYTRDSLILITDASDGLPTFSVCIGAGSPGTWRALAPAGMVQAAATTAAVNAAGVPTQAEFNAFVSAFNDLRTKLQTAKLTA